MKAARPMRGATTSARHVVALFAVVSGVPLALLAYFSLSLASDAVGREVEARLASTATLSAEVVDQELGSLSNLVSSYATRPNLRTALNGRDGQRLQFHLRQLKGARAGIAVAFLANPDGRLVNIAPPTPSIVGKDFSFRDWYRGVTQTRGPYISRAYRSQAAGTPLVVAAAAPVRSSGRTIAILVAGYSLAHLQQFSNHIARSQQVLLQVVDQRGTLVARSGGTRGLVSRMRDPRVSASLDGSAGITTLDTPDGRRLSAFAPAPRSGWAVTTSVPAGTALAAISGLRTAVLTIAALLAAGLLGGLVLLGRTLASRQRAEEAARRQGAINQSVLEATRDGIAMTTPDGRIAVANTRFARLVNEAPDDAANVTERRSSFADVSLLIAEPKSDVERYPSRGDQPIEHSEDVIIDEYELDEPTRLVERYVGPVRDSLGKLIGRIIVLRDVTAERAAARARTEMTATVSHELRTPLASILGFAELLVHRKLSPEMQVRHAETIHRAAARLTNIVNEFLDLQRIELGQMTLALKSLDVRDVVRAQAELFSGQSHAHTIVVDVSDEPLTVLGDSDRLSQVLGNLFSNAIKYSPNGGEVTVSAYDARPGIRLRVTDHGLGIPAAQRAQIFEKFFRVDSSDTRQIGGTGLGLALSREIVEAHGGQIGFDSVEGRGSTFWINLPSGHGHGAADARVLAGRERSRRRRLQTQREEGDRIRRRR